MPSRSERSHYVRVPAPWVAGCSDTGLRHSTNQDALCLAVRGDSHEAVVAVADGVTTAFGSEVASLIAAETLVEQLIRRTGHGENIDSAFTQGFAAANDAVLNAQDMPAACTLIGAQIAHDVIVVGNVGDSRAYWLGDDGTVSLLSTDDSMAQARIMLGMSRDDAEASAQAHAITKWLGRMATNVQPTLLRMPITGNGWLMLCSDGLWNYASSPEAMAQAFYGVGSGGPQQLSEALVAWALDQGGKDNVTVVVARIER